MINRFVAKGILAYSTLKNRAVFLILFLVSFFIRLPFFFRDYIDRDESTFILMGQSWVDGHLPYTELWDLKPPITFLFFAGIIYLFGKSFIAIRLAGVFVVAITAFFSYNIAASLSTKKVALWAGIFSVALQSMFGSIQGVMSEHICIAFFMVGLYLLIRYQNFKAYLGAGLFMGLAVMTKLNIAYAVLFAISGVVFHLLYRKKIGKGLSAIVLFGIGVLGIVLLTILPYYFTDATEIWWKSVILASLEYAGARRSSILSLAPTFLIIGAFLFFSYKKNYLNFKDAKIQLLTAAMVGVLFSYYKAGRINSHYLIQLYPIVIILFAIVVSRISFLTKLNYRPYAILLLLVLPMESYLEYVALVKHKMERGTFYNGEGITVPQYLKEHGYESKNILFLEYHIGYWPLGASPPTKAATHPSSICRFELFPYFDNPRKTNVEELQYIMQEVRPKLVVTRKNRLIFDKKLVKENQYINNQLKANYKILATVDQAEIYQRL
ncbi:MAG: glycosyltransferase family 39 protein [Flavobacteriaceae bacterium]